MNIQGLKEKLGAKVEEAEEGNFRNQLGYLKGMNQNYNMYGGTADPYKVAKRRAKNKVGSKSRRANRNH
jgi:hypothetical protein